MSRNSLSDDHKKPAEKLPVSSRNAQQSGGAVATDSGLTRGQRNMLTAQHTLGNRAVLRMIQRDPADDAAPADPQGAAPADPQSISDGSGNSVSVAGGVAITSSSPVTISAPAINLSASTVKSDAAIFETAGISKSSTVITDSVIAASYTPGAGNVF